MIAFDAFKQNMSLKTNVNYGFMLFFFYCGIYEPSLAPLRLQFNSSQILCHTCCDAYTHYNFLNCQKNFLVLKVKAVVWRLLLSIDLLAYI